MGGADYSRPAFPGRAYARKGREPYYAPNPLCGACFAKASQPEGAEKLPSSSRKCGTSEDMSKGARGGRGGRLLFRLRGVFRGVVPELFVVGLHIFQRLSDFIGRFFGGGSHLVSGLNRGGVEFGGEVGLDLLQFVDGFRQLGADGADFFVQIGVLFLGFVQSGLADGFEVTLHFGQIFFPVGEAGVGDGAEVIDSIREGGLDVLVVFKLVGEVLEGVAGFV